MGKDDVHLTTLLVRLLRFVTVTICNMSQTSAAVAPAGDARRRRWKEERRAELLRAAERTVRRMGPAASMDAISKEAGVSRMVLYRYFGDKGGLYRALATKYVRDLMGHLERALRSSDDPRAILRATIETYVTFIEDNHESYAFLMHRAVKEGPEAQATVADFMRRVASEVAEILKSELERAGLDPTPAAAWAHGLVGMVHLSADWWLGNGEMSRAELVDYLFVLASQGLFEGSLALRG